MKRTVERIIDTLIPELLNGKKIVLDNKKLNKLSLEDIEEIYYKYGIVTLKKGKYKICFQFEI